MVHRAMALFMGLLLIFTVIWLRARLLNPRNSSWRWPAPSHSAILPSARTSAGATKWRCLARRSIPCRQSYQRATRYWNNASVRKPPGLSKKRDPLFPLAGEPSPAYAGTALRTSLASTERPANLTLLRDLELRVYDVEDEETIRNLPVSRTSPATIKGVICARAACRRLPPAARPSSGG